MFVFKQQAKNLNLNRSLNNFCETKQCGNLIQLSLIELVLVCGDTLLGKIK